MFAAVPVALGESGGQLLLGAPFIDIDSLGGKGRGRGWFSGLAASFCSSLSTARAPVASAAAPSRARRARAPPSAVSFLPLGFCFRPSRRRTAARFHLVAVATSRKGSRPCTKENAMADHEMLESRLEAIRCVALASGCRPSARSCAALPGTVLATRASGFMPRCCCRARALLPRVCARWLPR